MVSFDCIADKPSYTSKAYTGHTLHNALQISVSDAENWQSFQGLYTYLSCKLEFLPVNTFWTQPHFKPKDIEMKYAVNASNMN